MEGNYVYKYPHPAVTTDCVIFGYGQKEGLSVLLIKRGIEPFKDRWALPGGFIHMDEDAETCARRELKEETGLEASYIEQFGCFSDVDRDPRERVITIAFFALVRMTEVRGGDDASDARWHPIDELPPLAFDHEKILRVALEKLRERIHFMPIGFELLSDVFTMPQLQGLYEAILNVKFDRRNFSTKMLKLGLLTEVGDRPKDAGSRIPVQYGFNEDSYTLMKSKGFKLEF